GKTGSTDEQRQLAHELLDLLTPIVKSWPPGFCLKASQPAIHILGGHGYTRDYPVAQYYRDNRLDPVHEATHGIQSLDLHARKLTQNKGAGLRQLNGLIQDSTQRAAEYPGLQELRSALEQLTQRLQSVTAA